MQQEVVVQQRWWWCRWCRRRRWSGGGQCEWPHLGIEDNVLHHRAEADRVEDLGLALCGESDALGVAAALDVEDALVRPHVFVVPDERAARVGRERRLAWRRQNPRLWGTGGLRRAGEATASFPDCFRRRSGVLRSGPSLQTVHAGRWGAALRLCGRRFQPARHAGAREAEEDGHAAVGPLVGRRVEAQLVAQRHHVHHVREDALLHLARVLRAQDDHLGLRAAEACPGIGPNV